MYDATGVIGLRYDNNTYYFSKNLQGDIIGIVDSSNERVATYEYDSWGKVLSIKDQNGNEISNQNHVGIINPFRYRGYYYDIETGLYYLNSRYYNPEWCRFVSADGIIGANGDFVSYNLYVYVSNNPISNYDASGMFFKKAWSFAKKVAANIKKTANNIRNNVTSFVKKVKKSFVFESEIGLGASVGGEFGPAKGNLGFSKTMGYSYSNNKFSQYTSTYVGASVGSNSSSVGLSFDIRNEDNGLGSPMAMPWEVWNDENTTRNVCIGVTNENLSTDKTESSQLFIGISFEMFLLVGGKVKIGFNVGE